MGIGGSKGTTPLVDIAHPRGNTWLNQHPIVLNVGSYVATNINALITQYYTLRLKVMLTDAYSENGSAASANALENFNADIQANVVPTQFVEVPLLHDWQKIVTDKQMNLPFFTSTEYIGESFMHWYWQHTQTDFLIVWLGQYALFMKDFYLDEQTRVGTQLGTTLPLFEHSSSPWVYFGGLPAFEHRSSFVRNVSRNRPEFVWDACELGDYNYPLILYSTGTIADLYVQYMYYLNYKNPSIMYKATNWIETTCDQYLIGYVISDKRATAEIYEEFQYYFLAYLLFNTDYSSSFSDYLRKSGTSWTTKGTWNWQLYFLPINLMNVMNTITTLTEARDAVTFPPLVPDDTTFCAPCQANEQWDMTQPIQQCVCIEGYDRVAADSNKCHPKCSENQENVPPDYNCRDKCAADEERVPEDNNNCHKKCDADQVRNTDYLTFPCECINKKKMMGADGHCMCMPQFVDDGAGNCTCPSNTFYDDATNTCLPCPEGYHMEGGACVANPAAPPPPPLPVYPGYQGNCYMDTNIYANGTRTKWEYTSTGDYNPGQNLTSGLEYITLINDVVYTHLPFKAMFSSTEILQSNPFCYGDAFRAMDLFARQTLGWYKGRQYYQNMTQNDTIPDMYGNPVYGIDFLNWYLLNMRTGLLKAFLGQYMMYLNALGTQAFMDGSALPTDDNVPTFLEYLFFSNNFSTIYITSVVAQDGVASFADIRTPSLDAMFIGTAITVNIGAGLPLKFDFIVPPYPVQMRFVDLMNNYKASAYFLWYETAVDFYLMYQFWCNVNDPSLGSNGMLGAKNEQLYNSCDAVLYGAVFEENTLPYQMTIFIDFPSWLVYWVLVRTTVGWYNAQLSDYITMCVKLYKTNGYNPPYYVPASLIYTLDQCQCFPCNNNPFAEGFRSNDRGV